jgi:hypothetical protein
MNNNTAAVSLSEQREARRLRSLAAAMRREADEAAAHADPDRKCFPRCTGCRLDADDARFRAAH